MDISRVCNIFDLLCTYSIQKRQVLLESSLLYWQRNPPSTAIAMPVTHPTSSLASITAIRAISVAEPTPLSGCTASICRRYPGLDAKSEEVIGVAVTS
jgi:hypothetical protein